MAIYFKIARVTISRGPTQPVVVRGRKTLSISIPEELSKNNIFHLLQIGFFSYSSSFQGFIFSVLIL